MQIVLRSLRCVVKVGVDDVDVAVTVAFLLALLLLLLFADDRAGYAGPKTKHKLVKLWVKIEGGKFVLFVEYYVNTNQQTARLQPLATFFVFLHYTIV